MNERAFLDAILENPDDDTSRLVFADWLEEHGQEERAEFIRVQIELARMPQPPRVLGVERSCSLGMLWASRFVDNSRRQRELETRQRELLERNEGAWWTPLRGLGLDGEFHRGFVEEVSLKAETFCKNAEELFRLTPIRKLRLTDARNWLGRVVQIPLLQRVRSLIIHGEPQGSGAIRASGARLLADCPHLSNLTALTLPGQLLLDEGMRLLGSSPHLASLRELNLPGNQIGADGVRALAESPHLTRLRVLGLGSNRLGAAGVEALAAPNLARLESLDCSSNSLHEVALQRLTRSAHLTRLQVLNLRSNNVGREGARALAEWTGLHELTTLDLSQNGLHSDGVAALASSPHLTRLIAIALAENRIGGPGVRALVEAAWVSGLKILDLSGNRLCAGGARTLARSQRLSNLVRLNLSEAAIGDAGAKALAEARHFPHLVELALLDNGMTDEGTRAVLDASNLDALEIVAASDGTIVSIRRGSARSN